MRQFQRPALGALALLLTALGGGQTTKPVFAQETPVDTLHCGPIDVFLGDLVALNVGNVGDAAQAPGVVQLRLLDANGAPLLERTITLLPGQSRAASLRLPRAGLVRGEVIPSSSDVPELRATLQVHAATPLRGLTYGPNVLCSGPTGHRGPV